MGTDGDASNCVDLCVVYWMFWWHLLSVLTTITVCVWFQLGYDELTVPTHSHACFSMAPHILWGGKLINSLSLQSEREKYMLGDVTAKNCLDEAIAHSTQPHAPYQWRVRRDTGQSGILHESLQLL